MCTIVLGECAACFFLVEECYCPSLFFCPVDRSSRVLKNVDSHLSECILSFLRGLYNLGRSVEIDIYMSPSIISIMS